jgi:transcriptional regulator with XRE-family HTH domain
MECAYVPIKPVQMAKTARHWRKTFLRDWREFRGRSLESVAARMGLTHGQLSKVERGKHPYNQHILEIAALEYRCEVADLLIRAPGPQDALPAARTGRRAS